LPPSSLPLISEADYPGFQQMIPELDQVSHDEWSQDHVKAVAYRKPRNGSHEVAISPPEFDMWLKQNKMTAHLELLWACVEDKTAHTALAATASL
jgi:hypothetical protein